MRTTWTRWLLLGALGACGADEPEAVEVETTETAGGLLTGDPQAARMHAHIRTALRAAPSLDADAIDVLIDGSSVRLAGAVSTPAAIHIAHDVVRAVPGVREVDTDGLRVR